MTKQQAARTSWEFRPQLLLARSLLVASIIHSTTYLLPAWGGPAAAPEQTLYSFSLVRPGGKEQPLAEYKGKVVVIVNLASKSSFADQVLPLEKLQERYKDQGLVVIGVPSNEFGEEEPGDDAEIQRVYAEKHATFPIMAKSSVCGKDKLPVYAFLTAAPHAEKGKDKEAKEAGPENEVHWSFTKFILTREGKVGARFEADISPESPDFEIAIEKALAGKLKSSPVAHSAAGAPGDSDEEDGGP